MKNPERWRPTKFVMEGSRLRASRDRAAVAPEPTIEDVDGGVVRLQPITVGDRTLVIEAWPIWRRSASCL